MGPQGSILGLSRGHPGATLAGPSELLVFGRAEETSVAMGKPDPPASGKLPSDDRTEKPELHEVPGHLCNSGAQKLPKTTRPEPPEIKA